MNNFSTIVLCLNVLLLTSACNISYNIDNNTDKSLVNSCNSGKSCFSIGWKYEYGVQGYTKDYSKAIYFYQRACNFGNEQACNKNLNNNSSDSNISNKNQSSQGNGEYYFSLGWSYANGENGYTKDYSKATELYWKSCNLNNGGGCNNLGALYANGNGVDKSDEIAFYLFEKACKLNNEYGCFSLGNMYAYGKVTLQDYQKAKLHYNKSCQLGYKVACNINLNNNSSDSNISYEESCRRGNSSDCFTVGTFYEKGSNGYARNYLQAKTYYDKACTLRKSHGCHALGMLFVQGMGVNEDFSTARFYFKRACDLGKSESCILYGELQSSGY